MFAIIVAMTELERDVIRGRSAATLEQARTGVTGSFNCRAEGLSRSEIATAVCAVWGNGIQVLNASIGPQRRTKTP